MVEHGGDRKSTRNNCVLNKTQEQLAADMNMDVRTLQNYKMMAEMIPELEDLMDTGIVTKVRQSPQPHSYSTYLHCGKKTCLL